ncbi:MAG: GlsB/YeaQ/YmgE family stress response membrane protein [Actinomycetota bacterium]|nr:GlsB/YeaQ/YmgE family stress response membrane protein [Actinomycetota bacterium]
MEIIGLLIGGVIIGLLGKFVAPGDRDNIPIWLTILCGIAGILIGYYIYSAFGGGATTGVDWVRWIVAIIVAAVLVMIASAVTGGSTRRGHKV